MYFRHNDKKTIEKSAKNKGLQDRFFAVLVFCALFVHFSPALQEMAGRC
jgi:hypothetical protein